MLLSHRIAQPAWPVVPMPFLEHFGLTERPFALTPNSGLYYPSKAHHEVLTSLMHAIDQGEGVIKVSGEVGTGKTLLCRMVTAEMLKTKEVAYIINPQTDPNWIIGAVCREFGLDPEKTDDRLHLLNSFLLRQYAAGRGVVLVIDEAQALGIDGLETVRRLSNLETDQTKLMQTVLFGQPELDELLDQRKLRQLNQRIGYSFTLPPLSVKQTGDYIHHRIQLSRVEGGTTKPLFNARAVKAIARASRGIPRITNIIADKSLLAAFAKRDQRVTARHVDEAIKVTRRVIDQLPDINEGRLGNRILGALNVLTGDSRPRPPTTTPSAAAKAASPQPRLGITVTEACDEWLAASQDRGLKAETLGERRRQVENIIKPTLGEYRAGMLTAEQIESFVGQVAPGDARRVLAAMNSILAETVRRRHFSMNPAKGVKIALDKPAQKPPAGPTTDEIRTLLPAGGDALFVRMATALLTGLRVNEMRALSWDDLDLDNGMIHVRRSAAGSGEMVPVRPKPARRSLPIASTLVEILSEWRDAHAEDSHNLVFPGKDGGLMSAGLFQRGDFARLQKKLGMSDADGKAKYRFEDLRHAAARLLIEQGWLLRKLRDDLGEASMAATARRYGDSFARIGTDRSALTLIADRLIGPTN